MHLMYIKNLWIILFTALFLLLPGCKPQKNHIKIVNVKLLHEKPSAIHNMSSENTPPPVTIWIHGTFFFTNHALPSIIRCPRGLTHIYQFDKNSYHEKLATSLTSSAPDHYSMNEFYIFGWSGKLSFYSRKKAAHELYHALEKLTKKYLSLYKKKPCIRIITHSHGGNVALNLALFENQNKCNIVIDDLILLACPVQHETKHLIHHNMFKKIISLVSGMDMIQIIDPQGIYPKKWRTNTNHNFNQEKGIFSDRFFKPCSKLVQIQLKKNIRGLFHIEFMLPNFLKQLPNILENCDYHITS